MRRDDICLYLSPGDRAELQSLARNRNTPRKLVWRAEVILAIADLQVSAAQTSPRLQERRHCPADCEFEGT